MKDRRGFTLIELAAVLLILALAAAATVLRLEGPLRRAQMSDAADLLAAFDRLTREEARLHDRALSLSFDLVQQRVRRAGEAGEALATPPLVLPPGCRISKVWVRGAGPAHQRATVPCSRQGYTPTYGLLVEGQGGRRAWIIFAGLSGRSHQVQEERDVQAILGLAAPRPHAG